MVDFHITFVNNFVVDEVESALCLENDAFEKQYGANKPALDTDIIFNCRAGVRSLVAIETANKLGFERYVKVSSDCASQLLIMLIVVRCFSIFTLFILWREEGVGKTSTHFTFKAAPHIRHCFLYSPLACLMSSETITFGSTEVYIQQLLRILKSTMVPPSVPFE